MLKLFTAVLFATFFGHASAADQVYENLLNAKKRVRLILWYHGLKIEKKQVNRLKKDSKKIPVEIEKPLEELF